MTSHLFRRLRFVSMEPRSDDFPPIHEKKKNRGGTHGATEYVLESSESVANRYGYHLLPRSQFHPSNS